MSIDPKAYYDETVFEDELANIFSRRLYIGTISEFPEIDSYKTVQLGREPITVRRTADGMRAFTNVCLHRSALIDPPGSGVRPFRCPYHAWGYGPDGALTHAPKIDMGCLERTHLKSWRVEVADGLVFIGADDLDVTKVPPTLRHLSIEYSPPFFSSYFDHDCNWKLLVENVLEGYHLSPVHPKTFVPTGVNSNSKFTWAGHDYINWSIVEAESNPRNARLVSIVKGTRLQYGHVHVFPNVFVSNGNDQIGYIGHFIPVSPTRTRLEWCLFEQALLLRQNDAIRESLRNAAIEFTNATLMEDKSVAESCQIGLRSRAAGYQMQLTTEPRVMQFQAYYRHVVSNA